MYTLVCSAGYPNPVKRGKHSVCHVSAVVKDTTASARVTLVDNAEEQLFANDYIAPGDTAVIDVKTVANSFGNIDWKPTEPIKLRNGLSAVNLDNIVSGTLKVFVR
jgi:hypothetical protein